jgi:hypothetical protein
MRPPQIRYARTARSRKPHLYMQGGSWVSLAAMSVPPSLHRDARAWADGKNTAPQIRERTP